MGSRTHLPATPHIHFMAAAPLDAWVRLMLTPGARIGWRYWPRVGVNLALSACVTAITLPERVALAPILWWKGARSRWRLGARGASRPAVVVLGYYRSGTTHLHNLLACDPANHAPRWGQMLAPQGFVLSWFVLRLFLTAVLPTRRPQDDMAFGPEWPGEDDFALSNWSLASPLPGRVVLPRSYQHFRRFHDLERLTARERARWRRTQWAILWKVAVLAPGRRLLLKTPAHTARVPALGDTLGPPGSAKFIHLSREPGAVLTSNERLMRAMAPFHLQDGVSQDEVRGRLIAEYSDTERRFLDDAPAIPAGNLVRMRYQDLIADPIGELRRAYDGLGLAWTPEFERRLGVYLDSVREYRSETQKLAAQPGARPPQADAELPDQLRWMIPEFGHDRPPRHTPTGAAGTPTTPKAPTPGPGRRRLLDQVAPVLASVVAMGLWWLVAWLTGNRHEGATFLVGLAIGHVATRRSPGSVTVGLVCAGLSVLATLLGVAGATRLVDFVGAPPRQAEFRATLGRHLTHESTLLWAMLGMVGAYRLGSRRFGAVPGR